MDTDPDLDGEREMTNIKVGGEITLNLGLNAESDSFVLDEDNARLLRTAISRAVEVAGGPRHGQTTRTLTVGFEVT